MVSVAASGRSGSVAAGRASAFTPALTRKSILVRKRDHPSSPSDDLASSQSSTKRARVAFSQEVETRTTDEFIISGANSLLREEVRRALERRQNGDSSEYSAIKERFQEADGDDEEGTLELPGLVMALTAAVGILSLSCSDLVQLVIKSGWIAKGAEYLQTFTRFLGALVSARAVWLPEVLQVLVEKFSIDASPQCRISRKEVRRRSHAVIQYLLKLVPSATNVLVSILSKAFPPPWESKHTHIAFVYNLLHVVRYAPELRAEILSTITDRLVKIDVQIQNDIEDLEDLDERLIADIPQSLEHFMDTFDGADEEGSDDGDAAETDGESETEKAKTVHNNIQKTDLLMDMLFDYYEPFFEKRGDAQDTALDLMLSQFNTIILPAYRSRHTQFLLFHFSQKSPIMIDNFVGYCIHMATDKGRSALSRQSAAAYLASFVARGAHVPAAIVRDVFTYIGDELELLRLQHEPKCRVPDLQRFSTYYSLVQAILYIFCFRWHDLEATASDTGSPLGAYGSTIVEDSRASFLPGVKEVLASNLFSKLNPLKVCSPIIVGEFAKIANYTGILYVFHIIETNKRLRLTQATVPILGRESTFSARRDEAYLQLDEYFPFDPYHLPRSKRWLAGDYREWEPLPGADDEESGAGSDSGESDVEDGAGAEVDADDSDEDDD